MNGPKTSKKNTSRFWRSSSKRARSSIKTTAKSTTSRSWKSRDTASKAEPAKTEVQVICTCHRISKISNFDIANQIMIKKATLKWPWLLFSMVIQIGSLITLSIFANDSTPTIFHSSSFLDFVDIVSLDHINYLIISIRYCIWIIFHRFHHLTKTGSWWS